MSQTDGVSQFVDGHPPEIVYIVSPGTPVDIPGFAGVEHNVGLDNGVVLIPYGTGGKGCTAPGITAVRVVKLDPVSEIRVIAGIGIHSPDNIILENRGCAPFLHGPFERLVPQSIGPGIST